MCLSSTEAAGSDGSGRFVDEADQLTFRRHSALTRRRRNILFPSGVTLCNQETFDQAAANHLSYFHLRVCQETVWEAFKIFWDRLPERDEYQQWVGRCIDGSVGVHDIGSFFSQSEEHISLIRNTKSTEPAEEVDAVKEPVEPSGKPIGNEIDAAAPWPSRPLKDHVVELSIRLRGETYNDALRNPSSFEYQLLARHFTRRVSIEDAFVRLPGFKKVHIVEFRGLVVLVHYAITLEVDGGSVANDTLDFISLQNNLVEKNYPGAAEQPTVVYTITDFRNYITEALHKDNFMTNSSLEAADPLLLENGTASCCLTRRFSDEDEPAAESSTTEKEVLIGVGFTETTALKEPLPDGYVEESFLDQVLVTPHISTDPRYSTTTQAPVFSPKGTLAIELSVQTVEASGIYDDWIEPNTLAAPVADFSEPEAWTLDAAVFVRPTDLTDLATNLPGTTEELEEVTEAAATSEIPQVPDTSAPSTKELPAFVEVQAVTVGESSSDAITNEPPHPDVPTERPNLLPETPDRDVVEILEEQHIDSTHPTTAPVVDTIDQDLVVDEVMVVITTTVAPRPTPSVSSDHDSSIALSPEKDSPFTRVSDSLPEDEDLVHHEHPNHEAVTEGPISTPPSDVPQSTPETEKSSSEESPGSLASDGDSAPTSSLQKVNSSVNVTEFHPFEHGFSDMPSIDVSFDVFQYGSVVAEGDSSGFSSGAQGSDLDAIALPTRPGRALTVFFSLRVTNMAFSMDLFNKSSPEYKALEQRFMQLLVPYLQSNLNNFQNLEILNFRNGSIVVNSRMRFGKPVPSGVTNVIYLILEDFANTAYQTMNMAIDKYSLDVESGDRADPCKFQACNEFSRCMVNRWSGEAECVCDAGYVSVDGLPCQSVCDVQYDFCLNDGKCDIIPGKGAICRCRVGENWWYRGEHCEEYVSEPLVVGIAIASVAGFLMVAAGIIFFLARTLRDQYDGEDTEDPRGDSMPTLERATKFNPMFESDPVTTQYYRRYDDDVPPYSSSDASKGVSSTEIRNIYQNTTLSKEEIQERLRIIELCSRDQNFADFVRQTQV
uniref:Interphotoreceptor matrix proteoglycan 2b n=1 Tax=Stegastes partitus TaxID=144197 RepID=A0A3B4ZFV1_9TELE